MHFLLLFFFLVNQITSGSARTLAFVGGSQEIGIYEVNETTGNFSLVSQTPISEPGPWLAVYPPTNPTLLLACASGNKIVLFSFDAKSGRLTKLSEGGTGGIGPAYVSWDKEGKFALVANYGVSDTNSTGSNAAVLPITRMGDGTYKIEPPSAIVAHNGSSVNPDRQNGSHTHSILTDSTGRYAFACDLGLDRIWQYTFPGNGSLLPNPYNASAQPSVLGSGPRHIAFHPDQKHVFVVNEMGNSVDCFNYNAQEGIFIGPYASYSTIPSNFTNFTKAAEIAITPNGRFLYASNRGYDSIVGFIIDTTNTNSPLKLIGWTTNGINYPRSFGIDPSGKFLYSEGANNNQVVGFWIDQSNGVLTPNGMVISISAPQAIQIVTFDNLDASDGESFWISAILSILSWFWAIIEVINIF